MDIILSMDTKKAALKYSGDMTYSEWYSQLLAYTGIMAWIFEFKNASDRDVELIVVKQNGQTSVARCEVGTDGEKLYTYISVPDEVFYFLFLSQSNSSLSMAEIDVKAWSAIQAWVNLYNYRQSFNFQEDLTYLSLQEHLCFDWETLQWEG